VATDHPAPAPMTPSLRSTLRFALPLGLVALALSPSAPRAQDAPVLAALAGPPPPAPAALSLHAFSGTYATGAVTFDVAVDGGQLVVIARGPDAARRWSPPATAAPALDARAAAVLDGWVRGRLESTAAALPHGRRTAGEADVARFLRALTGRHGSLVGYRLMGTHVRFDGRAETLAEVAFERGREVVHLVWSTGGAPRLRTVTLGVGPVFLGRAHPSGRDAFALPAAHLSFRRGADDRILALALRDGAGAVEARRVAPAR
jgi:hypothetical protein